MSRFLFVILIGLAIALVASVTIVQANFTHDKTLNTNSAFPELVRATQKLTTQIYETIVAVANVDRAWEDSLWDIAKQSLGFKFILGVKTLANCVLVQVGIAALLGLRKISGKFN